jgi:hypothetical protein
LLEFLEHKSERFPVAATVSEVKLSAIRTSLIVRMTGSFLVCVPLTKERLPAPRL